MAVGSEQPHPSFEPDGSDPEQEQKEVVRPGAETDRGDTGEKQGSLCRLLGDVVVEDGDESRREHKLHHDEQPGLAEQVGRGQTGRDIENRPWGSRALGHVQQFDTDCGRDSVEDVGKQHQSADQSRVGGHRGSPADEQTDHDGGECERTDQSGQRQNRVECELAGRGPGRVDGGDRQGERADTGQAARNSRRVGPRTQHHQPRGPREHARRQVDRRRREHHGPGGKQCLTKGTVHLIQRVQQCPEQHPGGDREPDPL